MGFFKYTRRIREDQNWQRRCNWTGN